MNYSQNLTELIGNKTMEEASRIVANDFILPNFAVFYGAISILFLLVGIILAPRSKGKVFTIWLITTILATILFIFILVYPSAIPNIWNRLI